MKLIQASLSVLSGRLSRSPLITVFTPGLALGLCLLAGGASLSLAQSTGSATLYGTVKDQNDAVVPKAAVTLVNEATKVESKRVTNQNGFYGFGSVNPGAYSVRVENKGFKKAEQTGLILSPSDTRALDFTLQVGDVTEVVVVHDAPQTKTGAKENTITTEQIKNRSIISRSSLELLRTQPGVVAPNQAELERHLFGDGANRNTGYNDNGLRGEYITVTVDGSRMMDVGSNNGSIITANPDMVQEVKVQSSNYAAEHGSSAIQISVTTKGGASAFHGSLYDYTRDHRLGANDRSNNYDRVERPKSLYHYPGGNIGGPVYLPRSVFGPLGGFNDKKEKLFFFAGFEYYYQRVDEGSTLSVVPTLKQRLGDFSELLANRGRNLNQETTVNVPGGCAAPGYVVGQPAPNNNLAPCIDPIGRALINLYPLPNYSDPNNRYNYVYSVLRPTDRNQFISRIDYSVSEKTKLYLRLAREYETGTFPRGFWWNSSAYELPGTLTSNNLGRSVAVNVTNTIGQTMTNEILFSGSKLKLDNDYAEPDKVSYRSLGIQPFGFFPSSNPYVPVGIIDAYGEGIGGDLLTAYGYPLFAYNDTFSITDNLTKLHNSHLLKFGLFIEQANKKQNFNSDVYIELAQWGQPNGTGNNYGDLLVGRPINVSMGADVGTGNFRYYNYEFYAQDSWNVRPSFTLEFGLRLAYLPLNIERNGKGVVFDPRRYDPGQGLFINNDLTRPNGVLTAARGEIPKGLTENPPISWMPRLNLVWNIGKQDDLVVRGGGGLFYNRVQGNYDYYSLQQMPNSYRASADHWAQDGGLTFAGLKNIDPFSRVANVDFTSRNPESIAHPRVASMSLTVAKRLPLQNNLEVAYVGTQARHLPQNRWINIVPVGRLLGGTLGNSNLFNPLHRAALDTAAIKTVRPFQAYNNITFNEFAGTSSYHSLQATLSRQAGGNLQYFATYTFSKVLGTTAVGETGTRVDPVDTRGRSYGILPYDRTHIFNLSYNYNLPNLARGSLDHAFLRGLLNGWQISGITTFQSGAPIRLRFTGDIALGATSLAFFGTDAYDGGAGDAGNVGAVTPIYLKNPSLSNNKKLGERILDLNALAIPGFGQTGPTQPPFYIRTPSRSNWDVSFFKNFKFNKSKNLQFRAGFFNIFNQAYPTRIDTINPNNSDIFLTLGTVCNRRTTEPVPDGIGGIRDPGICDPTGGFSFTPETINNFGKITNKHGRRVIELALKFHF
jgi:hypothetical protein